MSITKPVHGWISAKLARLRRPGWPRRAWSRRGVVSVLSMMFLILFGSLAAAMAIVSQGNVRTAATHQHIMRAMGAAETGLQVAEERLTEAVSRFVVDKGTIDAAFATKMWNGTYSSADGYVQILPPKSFTGGASLPTGSGIAAALAQAHGRDANIISVAATNSVNVPVVSAAPNGTDAAVFALTGWVRTPAVALTAQPVPVQGQPAPRPRGTAFQIEYIPLASGNAVRVAVTGYDFDYDYFETNDPTRKNVVSRRITQDYQLTKRIDAAVLSPSKVMIGKNVLVEGDLGATFTGVTNDYGDPLVVRSDFWGLENGLNTELTKLFNALRASDVDKDNRLRVGHPVEGPAIPDFSNLPGYQAWTGPSGTPAWYVRAMSADVTEDGYVDEFDVFIMYYDGRNGGLKDRKVALPTALSAGTPNSGLVPEFVTSGGAAVDNQLALLLDSANPDRNKNGEWRFIDANANGRFDPATDELLDQDFIADPSSLPASLVPYVRISTQTNPPGGRVFFKDQMLGFRDGVIDRRDQYAKVRGRLLFRATSSAWQAAQPNYMDRVRGPILPGPNKSPMQFEASTTALPEVTADNFSTARTTLQNLADGLGFDQQVAANLNVSVSQLATWTTANNPTGASAAKLTPLSADANRDGLPDNWSTAYFEKMPFNSPTYSDWYYRPVYENMVFRNVVIPAGNNGLFKNCTFVGVTWVRSATANTHPNWTNYGKMKLGSSGRPVMDPSRVQYTGTSFPTMLSSTDRPVWMATTPLDKADIPANEVSVTQGYSNLPDPLIVNNRRVINTKELSNNLRFHDCLFVGSIVSDAPTAYTNARNKMQFTGATKFTTVHPTQPTSSTLNIEPARLPEVLKSSMIVPQYSVDIGQFNSPPTQDVRLRGAIIAGVLDVRGNADLQGSLVLTFKPVLGLAPLVDSRGQPVGNPSNFNASIGYFGPTDGDEESLDPATLPIVNGTRIVGWDLDGDGLPDLGPTQTPTAAQTAAGATAVPFYGYGQVTLRFDPTMSLPDGIRLPMTLSPMRGTYQETRR